MDLENGARIAKVALVGEPRRALDALMFASLGLGPTALQCFATLALTEAEARVRD